MSMTTIRGVGSSIAGLALIAIAAQFAGSAPVVGTGMIPLPAVGQTKDIWMGPAANRVGAKVTVTSGTAKVQATSNGATTPLGQIPAGNAIVFEGEYEKLTVVAMAANTNGSFENRAPIGGSDMDRLIGQGSVTCPVGGGAMGFYASQSAVNRLVLVQAGTNQIGVRLSHTGNDIVSVDPGDWTFCSSNNVTQFDAYDAVGGGVATYKIYDMATGCGPYTGTASGKNGDLDNIYADGSKNLVVTVTNNGTGSTLSVVTQLQGQSTVTTIVPAGGSRTVSGAVVRCDWTVIDADPNRVTQATFTVAGQ